MKDNFIPTGQGQWYNIHPVRYRYGHNNPVIPPFECYINSLNDADNYEAVIE